MAIKLAIEQVNSDYKLQEIFSQLYRKVDYDFSPYEFEFLCSVSPLKCSA